MSRGRSKKTQKSNSSRWMIWTMAVLSSLILLASFVTNKSPQMVLGDIYQYALGKKDKISKNDQQWEKYLAIKDSKIDSLSYALESMQSRLVPPTAKVKTNNTELNIRKFPSTDSDIVGKVADKTVVNLFYKDNEVIEIGGETGSWMKIEVNGIKGYVFSTYLEF